MPGSFSTRIPGMARIFSLQRSLPKRRRASSPLTDIQPFRMVTPMPAAMSSSFTAHSPSAARTMWRNAPTRTLDANGVTFAYRELGPRGGVPLVFLHHFTAVLDDWDPRVIDGIAAERHVIAFDNRGIGASSGSVPSTVGEMAADAVGFIRALGHEQVDLLGFSLGGGVAQFILL